MIGALWTGISGLITHQNAINNEANNISNVNTIGFKSSRISFSDQMYQDKIGKGTKIQDIEKIHSQGNLKVTGLNYDVAISGDGFFITKNKNNEILFTRAGNFKMGENGVLQDANGNDIQGWGLNVENQVYSTNENKNIFIKEYNKIIGNKIIKLNEEIKTITSKSTDYTLSAKSDSESFSGLGLKTKSSKITDIEYMINKYNQKMNEYVLDPNIISVEPQIQKTYINVPLNSIDSEGDYLEIYINNNKIVQSFENNKAKTLKELSDKISNIQGLKSYIVYENSSNNFEYTNDENFINNNLNNIKIKIESLIPGDTFEIGNIVGLSNQNKVFGSIDNINSISATSGSGKGLIDSYNNKLKELIKGDFKYVYDLNNFPNNFNINILNESIDFNNISTINDLAKIIKTNFSEKISNVYIINNKIIIESENQIDLKENNILLEKDNDLSGFIGAGAEYMSLETTLDQNNSQTNLQLKLNLLNISESEFGEFNVDQKGVITIKQDGVSFAVGQIAIAMFNNLQGLKSIGDNSYIKTVESGEPIYNLNNEKMGKVENKTLELSTTDLSETLVNLMIFQRAFEANAKSITTSDEILNVLINLKS